MPLYEFACRKCRHESEILVRGEEPPICPECGSEQLERLLSVPAAHTKQGASLPVCNPRPQGGCGAPWCGSGGGE